MENKEENAWVFDSLIGFLHGPIWNAPLQTFIEEKSLIFEPTDDGNVSDKKEYMVIFEEYKNLVDLMLSSYMDDIGITSEQFEFACQMSKENVEGLPSHFHQRLFEQIWAANDYAIFRRMMTQRNVELQLQALELIEQKSGFMPNSYVPGNDDYAGENTNDDTIMEEVKKLSLEELNNEPNLNMSENTNMEDIREEKIYLKSALENFQHSVNTADCHGKFDNDFELQEMANENIYFSKNESGGMEQQSKPLKEDVLKRQQYFKQQRDKLLTLKKQIREKQLLELTEDTPNISPRPKSSKTARLMLTGDLADKGQEGSLQLRKALAERLRMEVVDKS